MRPCSDPTWAIIGPTDRVRTNKTDQDLNGHSGRVPTRTDWPQATFLKWLDQLKDSLGLPSDLQLAQHLGIGHTLISGWRNGRQRPSTGTLTAIASATGEDPRHLWVLAGVATAQEVGLAGRPAPDPLPREITDLIALYRRSDKATRAVLLGQVAFLTDAIGGRQRVR